MGYKNYDLIAFGCSNTFGHGLPDCTSTDGSAGKRHSNIAWPTILKEKVDFRQIVNEARPGISNKQIAKRIIEYPNYTKNSIVVIAWTIFARKTIFSDRKKGYLHMLPNHTSLDKNVLPSVIWNMPDRKQHVNKIRSYYENFHEDFDACFDSFMQMCYIHSFLKNKNIKSYHLYCEHENVEKEYFDKFLLGGMNIKAYNWKQDFHIDDGLDKPHPHPGINSHRHFAENIKGWFFK